MAVTPKRKSAEERRESVLEAAYIEFAEHGLDGASTEVIAAKAGISQPYVFRLFGTKKQLFIAVVARFYREQLLNDRVRLRSQMQAYAASGDPEIESVVRDGYSDLVSYVEHVAGDLPPEEISRFFATGMLMNVIASMGLHDLSEPWAARLVGGLQG